MFYVSTRAPAEVPEPKTSAGTGAVMVFSFAFRLPTRKPNAATRLVPAEHVVSTVHGTRTVLLDARNGHYWGLDEVGTRIWAHLSEGMSREEVAKRLADEYDADLEDLQADVDAFLDTLRKSKLVRRSA